MSPPLSFRNSCNLEITCDEHGNDCQAIVSCDLVHRGTGRVHSFERAIDLQPLVNLVRRGLENNSVRIGSSMTDQMIAAAKDRAAKQARDQRSARGHGGTVYAPGSKPRPQNPTRAPDSDRQFAPPPAQNMVDDETLESDKQDRLDARAQAKEDREQARQDAIDAREQAKQDREDARQAAIEDRDYAREQVLAKRYPQQSQSQSDDDSDSDQADDISGSVARRIATSEGVNSLWQDAQPLISGGWWSDLKHTLNKYKNEIKKGAKYAAMAAGTAIAGPAGGAVAAQLSDAAVDAAAGDDHAKAVIAHATAVAKSTGDADQLHVLAVAKEAAKQAATAYHVADAAANAKTGDPQAAQFVANVHTIAKADPGNADAQTASQIASRIVGSNSYANALQMLGAR